MTEKTRESAANGPDELQSVDGMKVIFDDRVDLHPVELVEKEDGDAA